MYNMKLLVVLNRNGLYNVSCRNIFKLNYEDLNTQLSHNSNERKTYDLNKGFKNIYSEVIDSLLKINDEKNLVCNFTKNRLQRMIEYNLLNKDYYTIFPITLAYETLGTVVDQSQENYFLANVLHWSSEFLLAAWFMFDDMMDSSEMRWGQKCWYTIKENSKTCVFDAKLIEIWGLKLIKKYFGTKPYYKSLLNLVHYTARMTMFGQSLDVYNTFKNNKKINQYTLDTYEHFAECKTYFGYCRYSIYAAMHLDGNAYDYQHSNTNLDKALKKLSHIQQAQNDMWDLYANNTFYGKKSNDIIEGKFTWLIATAQTYANPMQLEVLEQNYGKKNETNVNAVQQVYDEINMYEKYIQYKQNVIKDVTNQMEEISNRHIQNLLHQCIYFVKKIDDELIDKKQVLCIN